MLDATQAQTIIEERIFGSFKTTAILSSYIANSTDIYGDNVDSSTYSVGVNIDVVPANYINTKQVFFQFGDLQKGEQDLVLHYNQPIHIKDKITFNGADYMVKEIKEYDMNGTTLLIAIRIVELL